MSQIEQTPTKQEEQYQQKSQYSSAEKTPKNNPLDDYKIIQEIGSGSFGKVYKARKVNDTQDKLYAIKRIKIQLLEQEMKSHQIFMEKLQVYFDFPGIPKMHSCFCYQGAFFFVMDFAQGGPFEQFLRFNSNGSLSFKVIQFYVAEMVLILEYLHLQGLAHRDFKPENMVISHNKHLQLIDFGTLNDFCSNLLPENLKKDVRKKNEVKTENLKKKGIIVEDIEQEQQKEQKASFLQPPKSSGFFRYDEEQVQNLQQQPDQQSDFDDGITYLASPLPVSRKRLTTFCGTNDYLSPEMLQEQKCDMNGDLWALGCIIYQMFTDKTPFHQKQAAYDALKERIITCSYEMQPNIPEVAQDIIKKLLVLQPDQRLGGVLVGEQLQRQDVVESYQKLKQHPFFEGINWENLYQTEAPHTAENFIRKGVKKQTAPPLQNIMIQEKAELMKTHQVQKKKQSEDLHDLQKMSDQSPLSNSPKIIFEKVLQERQWKVIKVSKLIQIQEEDKFFTINVFEPTKKTSKYTLVVDEHTTVQQKDQKVIVNNGKVKKAYIDYKDAKVQDFYNCLTAGIQKKFQKKSE